MKAQIRPNRLDISDRFPLASFTIHTDGQPRQAEIVIATSPDLFDSKEGRTRSTFYSSREHGALSLPRAEAVYTVPPEVLARFTDADKLWFGLATAPAGSGNNGWLVDVKPTESSPYISLSGLTDSSMRRVRMFPNRTPRSGFGSNDSKAHLGWTGDAAQPGMNETGKRANGGPSGNGPPAQGGNGNGAAAAPNGNGGHAPVPYDDGFGPLPPSDGDAPPQETSNGNGGNATAEGQSAHGFGSDPERDRLDEQGIEGPVPNIQADAQAWSLGDRPRALIEVEYEGARLMPSPAYSNGRRGQTIDRIAIHITDSPQSRYLGSWFTREAANSSSHYMVDQEGVIRQFVREQDTAWHAGNRTANRRSIGIEHVAVKQGGATYGNTTYPYTPPSEAEYRASARLVAHLCRKYGLEPNRTTIVGHNEINERTGHSSCPSGAWDWDRYMVLVAEEFAAAGGAVTGGVGAQGLGHAVHPDERGADCCSAAPARGGAPATASALGLTAKEYEDVAAVRPSPYFDTGRGGTAIDRIVIHITDAPTASSTINHLTNPGRDPGSSAHYLIAPDGAITQFVSEADTAWHAVGGNQRSIGIEHVAVKEGGATYGKTTYPHQPPTDAEYRASAKLVAHLCNKYSLPANRTTIVGHNQVDTRPRRASCPVGAWDWDRYMQMVEEEFAKVGTVTGGIGQGLGAGQSKSINWDEVQLVPQPTDLSCWATAAAMVIGWRDRMSVTPQTIADIARRDIRFTIPANELDDLADEIGLTHVPGQSMSPEGWFSMLESKGPLAVSEVTTNFGHVVVVTGMYKDGDRWYVRITDPLDRVVGTPGSPGGYDNPPKHTTGSRYIFTFEQFVRNYEALAPASSSQIMHANGTHGHTPNRGGSTPSGYAQGMATALAAGPTINWDEVQVVPQPTNRSCWATAGAMLFGWKEHQSVSPATIAEFANKTTDDYLNSGRVEEFAHQVGLDYDYGQSYTPQGFFDRLSQVGPLFVMKNPSTSGRAARVLHCVIVTGMYKDGNQWMVRIADPWDRTVGTPGSPGSYASTHITGSRYIMKYEDFVAEYEGPAGVSDIQVLHAGGHHGHLPNTGQSTPEGYAMGAYGLSDIALDPGEGGMSLHPDALQAGDLIVTTTAEPISGIIRVATGQPVSHVMLYVGQGGQVIEARADGVKLKPLTRALEGATLAVAYRSPEVDEMKGLEIADKAAYYLDNGFDFVGIVQAGLFRVAVEACRRRGLTDDQCRRLVAWTMDGTANPDRFFCSALALRAFEDADRRLTVSAPNWASPGDIPEYTLRTGSLEYVGHLITPPQFGSARTGAAQALGNNQSRSINWDEVQQIAQPTGHSCWATAAAMVIGWKNHQSVTPQLIADISRRSIRQPIQGQDFDDLANEVDLKYEPAQSLPPEEWFRLLEEKGPLFVAEIPSNNGHVVVMTGMYNDGGNWFVRITDPWDRVVGADGQPTGPVPNSHATGSRYILPFGTFVQHYERAAPHAVVQVLHANGTHGHTPNRGTTTPPGYAMSSIDLQAVMPKLPANDATPPVVNAPTGTPSPSLAGQPVADHPFGPGVTVTRQEIEKGKRRYSLSQLRGFVNPQAGAMVESDALRAEPVLLGDWPYIDGPSGRTQAGIAIDWAHKAGAVGEIGITPLDGTSPNGWDITVRADLLQGSESPGKAQVKVRVTTTFTKQGEGDQVAVSEVTLDGDGRSNVQHGVGETGEVQGEPEGSPTAAPAPQPVEA